MAVKKSSSGSKIIESSPKNTRQGRSKNTKISATSRNGAGKRYRGQGKLNSTSHYYRRWSLPIQTTE
jgi:hypothetical protein